jgi:predicted RNA-binding protein with PUA-like domain
MSQYWLVKTESSEYSFDDLERERKTVWSGVSNNLALIHLRSMRKGDRVLVYHTGKEKAIVGIARVASAPYPDPAKHDDRLVVVDLVPEKRLHKPITLEQIKSDKRFADFPLVRISRLSVMPVTREQWDLLLKMGK